MSYQISVYSVEKLSDFSDIQPGFAFKSNQFLDDSQQIPLVKGENLQQGYIDWHTSKYWRSDEYEDFQKYHLLSGDIVIAMDRPWVTAGLKWSYIKRQDPKSLLVQRVARVRAKNGLDQIYLRYLISSEYFSLYVQPIVTGVNVPHISGKQIGDFRIPVPELKTQKKIAAILSAYDDLIENNKRRIALLENMAEEIYREWFVRFRFPGYQTAEFEKGIPKGWGETNLGAIANILMGQSPKSEFYNTNGDGLPFHQGVGSYGERFPVNETFCSVDGRTAIEGDVLFSVRAPVGRLNIANEKMIIGRGLAAISHRKGYNSYLFYLLKVAFTNEDIIGNGAIFNSVGKEELRGFKIFSPPKLLVEKFETQASIIDKQIAILLQSLEHLNKTKNMLLPRLISGKLSVEDLDIQFPPSMQDTPTAI